MAKPEWGLKRMCRDCGKRFYDFHRNPIVCPGCQAVFDPLALLRPRRARAMAAPSAKAAEPVPEPDRSEVAAEVEESEIGDDADIDREDDDAMIKDTSGLGADDIPDVIEDEQ